MNARLVAVMDAPEFSRRVSLAAGAVNVLGVLIFSNGFTNPYLSSFSPEVFSLFGLICIMLWGLAYIAAGLQAPNWRLYAVFALEKALYGVSWIHWMLRPDVQLATVFQKSLTAGLFYTLYGAIDWSFGIAFALIAWRAKQRGHRSSSS